MPHEMYILDQSRRKRWAEHAAHMEEVIKAHNNLFGKPEGKRPPGWPRHRWEEHIKYLKEYDGRVLTGS